jgi:hypothetical protein
MEVLDSAIRLATEQDSIQQIKGLRDNAEGMVGEGIDQTDDFIRRIQESRNRISSTYWRLCPGGVFA